MARRATLYIYFLRPDRQGPTLGPIHALTKKASLSHIYHFAKIQLFACFTSQRTLFSHEVKNGHRHSQPPLPTLRHAASSALIQYDRGQKTDCCRGSTTMKKAGDSTKGTIGRSRQSHRKRVQRKLQKGQQTNAVRCEAQRSTLQQAMQCAAMADAAHCVSRSWILSCNEEHRKMLPAAVLQPEKTAFRPSVQRGWCL